MSDALHNPNEGRTVLFADALAMVEAATAALKARVAELTAYAESLDAQLIAVEIATDARVQRVRAALANLLHVTEASPGALATLDAVLDAKRALEKTT